MKKWEELPENMRNAQVMHYYDILKKRQISLWVKRIFDIIMSIILLILLSPALVIISILIKRDSEGPILYKQVRVTSYGREFEILKFRTMINNADKIGTQVTTKGDARITKVGRMLRKARLDEFPQLFNVLAGDMTFVGTRPEVPKYTQYYTDDMKATLLLPAGITSRTSIEYKDEEKLLENATDADKVYVEEIMPEKMKINLREIEKFSFWRDIDTMIRTVLAVLR